MASAGKPEGETLAAAVRFGRFELRPVERQLLEDDRPATLGSRAFDVLQALVEGRGRIVSKNELLEIAWPGLVVEENNLTVQVSALRKLLGHSSLASTALYVYVRQERLTAMSLDLLNLAKRPEGLNH